LFLFLFLFLFLSSAFLLPSCRRNVTARFSPVASAIRLNRRFCLGRKVRAERAKGRTSHRPKPRAALLRRTMRPQRKRAAQSRTLSYLLADMSGSVLPAVSRNLPRNRPHPYAAA